MKTIKHLILNVLNFRNIFNRIKNVINEMKMKNNQI